MAAAVSISIDPVSLQIQSGGRASARIILLNKGDAVGQYVLSVQGLDPAWYKLDSTQAGVFPGDKALAQISLRPPLDAVSATYQVVIQAQSQVDPADQIRCAFNLTIQRLGEASSSRPPTPDQPGKAGAASGAQPTVMRSNVPAQVQQAKAGLAQPTQPRPDEPSPQLPPVGAVVPAAARPSAPSPNPAVPAGFGQAALHASSPSGQVLFSADRPGLKLPPGATSAMNLSLSNSSGAGVNMELVVKGPPLSWVSLTPPNLALGPGEIGYASLSISIPAQAPTGSYPLAVIAQSAEDPGLATRLSMMLEVTRPGELILELKPVQAQAEVSGEYSLQISQTGQSTLNVNLSARDEAGALEFTFTPPAVVLTAEGKASSRLRVRSRQGISGNDSLAYTFMVSALPAGGGAASVNVQGSFVQLRPAPVKLLIQPDEIRDPAQAAFSLRMVNPGETSLAYRLSAADPDGSCTFQFENSSLTLPPKGEAGTIVHVSPQAYLNAGEVIHTLRISAQPAGGAGSPLSGEVRFVQTSGQPPTLNLIPGSQTSAGPASYTVQVANPRSVPLQVELRAYDSSRLCQFSLEPSSMNIPPMYQAAARLDVSPVSDLLPGESKRICAFSVAGYPDNQPTPIIVEGTLLQVPGFTWRKLLPLFFAAVVLLGLGGLAVLWLFFTRFVH